MKLWTSALCWRQRTQEDRVFPCTPLTAYRGGGEKQHPQGPQVIDTFWLEVKAFKDYGGYRHSKELAQDAIGLLSPYSILR